MKILVGYDPPHPNSTLLDKTIEHAKRTGAFVYLLTSLYDGNEAGVDELEKREKELEAARKIFEAENISTESHILVKNNSPGEDIVFFAEEHEVDEIFIQIKKTSRVGKLVKGSTAQYIILNAPCTVVSVR